MEQADTFVQAQQALKHNQLSMMEIARRSGLSLYTIRSVREGKGNPQIRTLRTIIKTCQEASE